MYTADGLSSRQIGERLGVSHSAVLNVLKKRRLSRNKSEARKGKFSPITPRFFSRVEKTEGCWVWKSASDANGYGKISYRGRHESAHRVSYMIHVGEIPKDMFVLHKCDNPPCVNPCHLFLGTPTDNVHDMIKKGRAKSWEPSAVHFARLTWEDVSNIRRLHTEGMNNCQIGKIYSMSNGNISAIVRNRIWKTKHVFQFPHAAHPAISTK